MVKSVTDTKSQPDHAPSALKTAVELESLARVSLLWLKTVVEQHETLLKRLDQARRTNEPA